ncbi:MAG TPA: hypothetical protein ENF25_02740 [Thermoprotei archaeon]|nr:hypothetical protein [Thermoprotei archaeon]
MEREETIKEIVRNAVKSLLTDYYFSGVSGLADVIMGARIVYAPGNYVAFTDGGTIYIGDMFLDEIMQYDDPIREAKAIVLHEACHILFDDVYYLELLMNMGVLREVANIVFDQWINYPLRNEGYKCPVDWSSWIMAHTHEPWDKYDKITTAILINSAIKKRKEGVPKRGVPRLGRGSGGPKDPSDIKTEDEMRGIIKGGVREIQSGNRGRLKEGKEKARRAKEWNKIHERLGRYYSPTGGEKTAFSLDNIWETSEWSKELVSILVSSIESSIIRTWSRRHRKFPGLFPGRTATISAPYIVAMIDTSGSMSDTDILRGVSAIHEVSSQTGAQGFVVFWSAEPECYEIYPIDDLIRVATAGTSLNIPRGGTSVKCAYEGFMTIIRAGAPDVINSVFFSDFMFPDDDIEYLRRIRDLSSVFIGVSVSDEVVGEELFDQIIKIKSE